MRKALLSLSFFDRLKPPRTLSGEVFCLFAYGLHWPQGVYPCAMRFSRVPE